MATEQAGLNKTLFWGAVSAALYWFLFQYANEFQQLAHTTLDACAVQADAGTIYYNKATPELCAEQGGVFIPGNWLKVFAPIAMAFVLSYAHGNFTGMFWDALGLKAKK